MSDRGVLFRDDMVRAILAGTKDVTRRVGSTWARVRPGDRLWVRETWAVDDKHPKVRVAYRADGMSYGRWQDEDGWHCDFPEVIGIGVPYPRRWRPSSRMPRWACRLELEVVSAREDVGLCGRVLVEDDFYLYSISDEEGRREGFADAAGFSAAWRAMHPDYSGPVYRIEFRRLP